MKLEEIIQGVAIEEIKGDILREIKGIHIDSRLVEEGDMFVAVKGTQTDGHAYIERPLRKGLSPLYAKLYRNISMNS